MNTEHFKQKLEEELKLVTGQLNELGWKDPETGEWDATGKDLDVTTPMADRNEAADQLEELVERQGETSTLQARRNEVKDALAKIAAGTYGTCEIGGETIEEDRLEANPAAKTCKAHME
jgi:RNA polymerase-binding transcription factor DksA